MPKGYTLEERDFRAIFDQYAALIHHYVEKFCHDPAQADHISGDVFAQLLEKLSLRRRLPSDPRIHVYRTAYDVISKHLRARGQQPPEFIKSLPSPEEEQAIKTATLSGQKNEIKEDG
jgi:DNA-directed RNA polymerase specialized sigma24 family protein